MSTYDKQTWEDYPSTNTPINADRLNHMENGIKTGSWAYDRVRSVAPYSLESDMLAVFGYVFPINKLKTMQDAEDGSLDISDNYVSYLGSNGLNQLENLYRAFTDISGDDLSIPVTPRDNNGSLTFTYISGGGVEENYTMESNAIPIIRYDICGGKGYPAKFSTETKPKMVTVYMPSNEARYSTFVDADRSVIDVKYYAGSYASVDKLWVSLINTNTYFAIAMYTEADTTYVVPFVFNSASHIIQTTGHIGARINSDWRFYYIMGFTFDESDAPSPGEDVVDFDMRFGGYGNNIQIYYNNSGELVPYTADTSSGPPSMSYSPYNVYDSDLVNRMKPDKITIDLKDGTTLTDASVYSDSYIATSGVDGYYDFLLADITSTLKLVLAYSGGTTYSVFVIDTTTHTYFTGGYIYSNGYVQDFDLHAKYDAAYQVIKNYTSDKTTWPSSKLDLKFRELDPSILISLQNQIDAIPAEKTIEYEDVIDPWSSRYWDDIMYTDANDQLVPYTSASGYTIQFPIDIDYSIYPVHWTPSKLSMNYGSLQISNGNITIDPDFCKYDGDGYKMLTIPIPGESTKYIAIKMGDSQECSFSSIAIIDTSDHTISDTIPGGSAEFTNIAITWNK